ncbi:MAG: glycosyltransferase, partial [Desulfovibrionaceae bacterium]|nr:glycosyltransferase [Desulfovibrionaceae bacterium]
MSNQPKVSVVMPCYNHEKYIEEAIESIQLQTYRNWELVLIDDCSTDNSVTIAKNIEKKDSRIRVIEHSYNKGTSNTLNDGIRIATGEYIAIQSADDISVAHRLEAQVSYFLEHPRVTSVSSYVLPVNDTKEVTEETKEYLYRFVVDTIIDGYEDFRQIPVANVTGNSGVENLLDGERTTTFTSEEREIVIFEFEKNETITNVLMRFSGGLLNTYYFDMYYSLDGENWTTCYFGGQSTNNMGDEVYSLGFIEAKY